MSKIEPININKQLNGWVLLDKSRDLSSNQALTLFKSYLKKKLNITKLPKIGHGGTLDPFASGLLPIAIGEATKTVSYIMDSPKTYLFTIKFGIHTKSFDLDSKIEKTNNFFPTKTAIKKILANFIGEINQKPPIYSAVKINGKRAYKLARDGKDVKVKIRKVKIYSLKLLSYKPKIKSATFIVKVGKGTYIRSLAYDISKSLNALGVISFLRRMFIHSFKEKPLLTWNILYNNPSLLPSYLYAIEEILDDILVINFSNKEAKEILNGKISFLESSFFKNFKDGFYQARYKNKIFSLIRITNGKACILRNFNILNLEDFDVDI